MYYQLYGSNKKEFTDKVLLYFFTVKKRNLREVGGNRISKNFNCKSWFLSVLLTFWKERRFYVKIEFTAGLIFFSISLQLILLGLSMTTKTSGKQFKSHKVIKELHVDLFRMTDLMLF